MPQLTRRAKEVLNYLQKKGSASAREALLDIDITSASLARRITELRDNKYPITSVQKTHPISGRRYTVYGFGAHD